MKLIIGTLYVNVNDSNQMVSSTFDPNQFKMTQREGWDSVAEGWKEWWEPIEKGAQKLSQRLIELAEIKPGQRVLDVATGIGEPSITAAKVVGTGGHVLATDISRQMLAIAKERATFLRLQDIIEFKESDAENLDLTNSSFDAALCRWGLMLFPNLDAAIGKIYSSLVSGGRFAAAVWADATKVPIISLATRIIGSQVQMSAPPPGVPNPFSLADTNKLENSLARAGFRGIHIDTVIVTFEFKSGEDYCRYCQAVSASARIALSKETEERKEDVWRKVAEEAARNYGTANGLIKMDNESICIVGTRP
ncbi:MAG TPA: methyltransferase domain-containing protein [Nitrososphaeraceae archaeon]|nr:methyltransferase domain-containing protein [Nitrososphaeraceae archaeon]